MSSVRSLILKKIGYVQGIKIGTQSDKTKFWLFALCSAVPTISGALGIIPKFFHNLGGEKRDRMYRELFARREATRNAINSAKSIEEMESNASSDEMFENSLSDMDFADESIDETTDFSEIILFCILKYRFGCLIFVFAAA